MAFAGGLEVRMPTVSHREFGDIPARREYHVLRFWVPLAQMKKAKRGAVMSINCRVVFFLTFAVPVFAQSDRGAITGAVSDPTGAIVASAPVEARNLDTGAVYNAETSTTGNYALSELPAEHIRLV